MTDEVLVTLLARTQEGPRGASLPIIIVQAASFDVFRLTVTERTLIRWGCKKDIKNSISQLNKNFTLWYILRGIKSPSSHHRKPSNQFQNSDLWLINLEFCHSRIISVFVQEQSIKICQRIQPAPIIMVQTASFDIFRLTVTERTLIRWGCKKDRTT